MNERTKLLLLEKITSLKDPEILKSALLIFKIKNDETLKLMLMQEITKKFEKGDFNKKEFEDLKDLFFLSQ